MGNRNTLYADVLMEELARSGLRHVCLSPGSRNTPLVIAAARNPKLKVTSHLDERSAAFFALGVAVASDEPVALVCTSGSAAANYFPAVVEAHQSRVPLIVITADRPHELRHSGANQTIDQVKMFGDYALWSADLALPEAQPPALAMRSLRTTAARSFAAANGALGRRGVVHLNVPFRPPLEPTDVPTDSPVSPVGAEAREDSTPFTQNYSTYDHRPTPQVIQELASLIAAHPLGLIVCGPHSPRGRFAAHVGALSERVGYPLLADGVSGVRFGNDNALGAYDTFLAGKHALPTPDLVLRFGGVPTSKWLNQYLDAAAPKHVIQVSDDGVWADDTHRTTEFVKADATGFVNALTGDLRPRANDDWRAPFDAAERATWKAMDDVLAVGAFFDGIVLHDIVEALPYDATLFVGNSLPVRHLDQFGRPTTKRIFAHANRGASGIDGNVSTAMGLGYGRAGKPVVGVLGDVTLYHDMNGLLAAGRCGVPITLVLLNNNGGGIFRRLPIKDFEPEFTQHFITPHNLDFAHAARLYGFDYACVDKHDPFKSAFHGAVASGKPNMIEVRTDAEADLKARAELMAKAHHMLTTLTTM